MESGTSTFYPRVCHVKYENDKTINEYGKTKFKNFNNIFQAVNQFRNFRNNDQNSRTMRFLLILSKIKIIFFF